MSAQACIKIHEENILQESTSSISVIIPLLCNKSSHSTLQVLALDTNSDGTSNNPIHLLTCLSFSTLVSIDVPCFLFGDVFVWLPSLLLVCFFRKTLIKSLITFTRKRVGKKTTSSWLPKNVSMLTVRFLDQLIDKSKFSQLLNVESTVHACAKAELQV